MISMKSLMKCFLYCICCLSLVTTIACRRGQTNTDEAQLAAMEARFAEFEAKAAELPYIPMETTDDGILVLADSNFMEAVHAGGILVVDFWMDGCPPCEAMVPVVKELALHYKDQVSFGKLHANSNGLTAEKYGVRVFPTLLFFVDAKPVGYLQGWQSPERMRMVLDKLLRDRRDNP